MRTFFTALMVGMLSLAPVLHAQDPPAAIPHDPAVIDNTGVEAAIPDNMNETVFGDSVRFTQSFGSTISSTTGLAISPLLGMGVLGVWKWYKTDPSERHLLPWYTHPGVWGVALGLFLLASMKDTIGVAIPEVLKKPLAAFDVLEDKLSGLIVALAVIPATIAAEFPLEAATPDSASLAEGGSSLVGMSTPAAAPVVFMLVPLMIGVFAAVYMVSHAVRCLLLLSPSSWVTAGIKAMKGVFLVGFGAIVTLFPPVGLALSLAIILFCVLISGWAFRWNVFGATFIYDFLLSRSDDAIKDGEEFTGFSRPLLPGVKPRTYGKVRREGSELIFSFRPWLILPQREVRVPLEQLQLGVRKGLLFPALTVRKGSSERHDSMFEFRRRFQTHQDLLAGSLQADEMVPSRVVQGAQSAVRWLREQIQGPEPERLLT